MGLKNVSEKVEVVKYNGIERVVEPGQVVDVRDFDINNSDVFGVEENILNKHRDGEGKRIFEQVKTASNFTNTQINEELDRLREELKEAQDAAVEKDTELTTANEEINNLKTELDNANKKIEKLEKKLEKSSQG